MFSNSGDRAAVGDGDVHRQRPCVGAQPPPPSSADRSEWHPQGVKHVASSVVSIPAIRHSILYLEGSHDPDMMSEVVPRFEPFERCCMAILFVGGRGKTTLHPTSPPPLLVNSDHHPLCQRVNATIFLGRGNPFFLAKLRGQKVTRQSTKCAVSGM